jgi:hypothetical protein
MHKASLTEVRVCCKIWRIPLRARRNNSLCAWLDPRINVAGRAWAATRQQLREQPQRPASGLSAGSCPGSLLAGSCRPACPGAVTIFLGGAEKLGGGDDVFRKYLQVPRAFVDVRQPPSKRRHIRLFWCIDFLKRVQNFLDTALKKTRCIAWTKQGTLMSTLVGLSCDRFYSVDAW